MKGRRIALLVGALLAAPLLGREVAAQEAGGRCVLEIKPGPRFNASKLPSGNYNTFLGGGVDAVCRGRDLNLVADSAEHYGDMNVLYLIGNVRYREPRVRLTSRRLTYWMNDERLVAEGDVVATLPSGTTMRGPNADYLRPIPGVRPRARMVATGRPKFLLVQTDSAGKAQEPVDLIADQVVMDGDSLVYASGRVEISRPDLLARGDSAFMDSGREYARLMKEPNIRGKTERSFVLAGTVIDLFSQRRQLQRVIAMGAARAVSEEDLDLRADTIDLRVRENKLVHAYAWGKSRAHATSPEQEIVADSLDIDMPGQRVSEVRAVRQAFAQSVPDTTRLQTRERDWLRGDTIVAYFDSTRVAGDTTDRPKIRELIARGDARSLYQIASNDRRATRPALNYVRGRQIAVAFEQRQVHTVTVTDRAAGIYLEPAPDTTAAPPATRPAPGQAPVQAPARRTP